MRKRGEVEVKRHSFSAWALCEVCGQLHDPAPLPTWKSGCTPTLRDIPYWPLFTEPQRTFPHVTAWVFLWPFLAIYDRSNCAHHADTSLRLYASSSRAEIAAVRASQLRAYRIIPQIRTQRFHVSTRDVPKRNSWRWLHAEHFLVVHGTIYIGYSKTIFQSFRKTNTLLAPIQSYLPLQWRKQVLPKLQ